MIQKGNDAMKKIITLILSLAMLLIPTVRPMAYTGGFRVENGVLVEYTGMDMGSGNELEIPSSAEVIGSAALNYIRGITSVYIPSSVTGAQDEYVFGNKPSAIYGHTGTFAQELAEREGIRFITLGSGVSGCGNFVREREYTDGMFSDVDKNAWYARENGPVAAAVELGLMDGMGDGTFLPQGQLRLCEAIVIACRLHNIYHGGSGEQENILTWLTKSAAAQQKDNDGTGEEWYGPYLEYALIYGIVQDFYMKTDGQSLSRPATRAEMAYLLGRALPLEALPEIRQSALNDVPLPFWDGGPSKSESEVDYYYYVEYIHRLARAGVVTGYEDGGFHPEDSITRAETATIVSRIASPELRVDIAAGS